jgi:hypothetical protein
MTSSLRFVFDTNTIVSALLLPDSNPRQALDRAQKRATMLIDVSLFERNTRCGLGYDPNRFSEAGLFDVDT